MNSKTRKRFDQIMAITNQCIDNVIEAKEELNKVRDLNANLILDMKVEMEELMETMSIHDLLEIRPEVEALGNRAQEAR